MRRGGWVRRGLDGMACRHRICSKPAHKPAIACTYQTCRIAMYRGWVCVARSHHICGKSVHETEAISVGIANQQGSHSEWGIA